MKMVSGVIVSTKPISVSKVARALPAFIAADNGASKADSAFLRRSSAAFTELALLHKELKPSRIRRKRKKHRRHTTSSGNPSEAVENPIGSEGEVLDGDEENDGVRKKETKKKTKKRGDFGGEYLGEVEDREREVEIRAAR
ncbi:hypothetical protein L1049_013246 [Liquidambar formosana]|uniref:Uncharacterized protein n=1 Tax=Liquidambar formosana TaxID=63359 RepID=A0AAP0RK89_LIQFO